MQAPSMVHWDGHYHAQPCADPLLHNLNPFITLLYVLNESYTCRLNWYIFLPVSILFTSSMMAIYINGLMHPVNDPNRFGFNPFIDVWIMDRWLSMES